MPLYYLDEELIFLIHNRVIHDFGGTFGLYKDTHHRVSSIISQQYPVFNYDKYPTVYQKAAMLLYFLAKGHCFVDGNKRVAIDSAIIFLDLNGYNDFLPDMEGYQKASEIAASQVTEAEREAYINEIANWLSVYFKKKREKRTVIGIKTVRRIIAYKNKKR